MKLSSSTEDYLKLIYELSAETGRASTTQLAERLGVAPASVTGMIQRLAEADLPLVVYHRHHGVELTPEGRRAALEVIRHHRLLELFLQRTLGYSWDEVHPEADRLEHVISEELEERIAQALGNPSHDPHGEPIPNRELVLPAQEEQPLSSLRPGPTVLVQRVIAVDPQLLRYLAEIGLVPGSRVRVLEYSPFDENLRLQVWGQEGQVTLGPTVTRQIFVSQAASIGDEQAP